MQALHTWAALATTALCTPAQVRKGCVTQGCQASCIIQGERVGLRLPVPTKEGVCACFV